jgi:hypothetical protein
MLRARVEADRAGSTGGGREVCENKKCQGQGVELNFVRERESTRAQKQMVAVALMTTARACACFVRACVRACVRECVRERESARERERERESESESARAREFLYACTRHYLYIHAHKHTLADGHATG